MLIHDAVVETSDRVQLVDAVTLEDVRTMASSIADAPRVATLVGQIHRAAANALDRAVG